MTVSSIRRATALAITTALVLPSGGVLAQSDLVPASIGDRPAVVEIVGGLELVASLDPEDERFPDQVADLERLLEATGADVGDVTVATAFTEGVIGGPYVAALRVADADRAALASAVISALWEGLVQPRLEAAELEGKPVILLHDDVVTDDAPYVMYSRDDTVWLLGGPADELGALMAQLP